MRNAILASGQPGVRSPRRQSPAVKANPECLRSGGAESPIWSAPATPHSPDRATGSCWLAVAADADWRHARPAGPKRTARRERSRMEIVSRLNFHYGDRINP